MNDLLNCAASFGTTGLEHLSDTELLSCADALAAMTKRDLDFFLYGMDTKYCSHVIRLCLQAEQILSEGDLDLERHSQMLLSLRRGEWTMPQIEEWFVEKEKSLETLYANSSLRHSPDEARIKKLLLEVLEMHYGSLDTVVAKNPSMENLINDLQTIMDRYKTSGCN